MTTTNRIDNFSAIERVVEVYQHASTVKTGLGKFTTVNELTDQVPALRSRTLMAAVHCLGMMGPVRSSVLLSEDDKGAVLAGAFAVEQYMPLAMARRYVYDIPGSITVGIDMEYIEGEHLIVNGVNPGDHVCIIDDTLSTGGTVVALAQAVIDAGAVVDEVRVVIEKVGFGGRKRVEDALGIPVFAAVGITIGDDGAIAIHNVFGVPFKGPESILEAAGDGRRY